ncbi:MAG: DOPA 4,5-dioxygenase family protein [Gammaproteobacteria bacterium]
MDTLKTARFHAHVYFEASQYQIASQLRKELAAHFELWLGRLFQQPVGPHPLPMFQVVFDATQFAPLIMWLINNRRGLDVLVHQDTGDDLKDHTDHVMWLGNSHPLRLEALRA